jgi:hypothetical protein
MKCDLLIAAAMMLAGCVTSHQAPKQYDFGDFITPRQRSNALSARLVVRDVTQPSWLRTQDIFYRLDYASPARPQRYAMSQWVATAGELVTRRLRDTVASANAGFTLQASNGSEGIYCRQTSRSSLRDSLRRPRAGVLSNLAPPCGDQLTRSSRSAYFEMSSPRQRPMHAGPRSASPRP